MNKLLLLLLLPITAIPAAHKRYTKAQLFTFKEQLEYEKLLEKMKGDPKKKKPLKKYTGPHNTPEKKANNAPFPEIVIEFEALDESKK